MKEVITNSFMGEDFWSDLKQKVKDPKVNLLGEYRDIASIVGVYARRHKEKLRNMSIEEWKKERQVIFAKYGWEIIFFDEVQLTESNVLTALKGGNHNF